MTDFEIANQFTDVMSLFLQGFALLSTVLFAYITGAFYFLYRAPIITKLMAFTFLAFATIFILINMLGAFYHYMALIDQVDQRVAEGNVSFLIEAIQTGRTRPMAVAGWLTAIPVILGTLAMCFWMTFFWTPPEESAPAMQQTQPLNDD